MKEKPSIAIIYHFVPHYRVGFVNALKASNKFSDYRWFASDKSQEGIPVIPSCDMGKFTSIKNFWIKGLLFQPQVIKIAFEANYDSYVFLSNPNFITTWIAAIILRLRGRQVIFWGHGFFSSDAGLKNRVRKIFFGLAHCTYLYGYRAKQQAINLGFKKNLTHVGFNSLNYEVQLLLRNKLEANFLSKSDSEISNRRSINILAISRLTRICEYDVLLQAVHIAAQNAMNFYRVTFVGDGPERQKLENLAKELKIDAHFMGAVYDEQKTAHIIRNADVVVQPGKIGLTAMHALMFGTPVISHSEFEFQMPEVEALIDGVTGMLHKKGDAQDLARCLIDFPLRFSDREHTRQNCYRVMDEVYNPQHQISILAHAASRLDAVEGDVMNNIFNGR